MLESRDIIIRVALDLRDGEDFDRSSSYLDADWRLTAALETIDGHGFADDWCVGVLGYAALIDRYIFICDDQGFMYHVAYASTADARRDFDLVESGRRMGADR